MADILIKNFPMSLNGRWGTFSERTVIHGDGSVTDEKGRNIGDAKAVQIALCKDYGHVCIMGPRQGQLLQRQGKREMRRLSKNNI